ncbi:hypothetical protein [Azospirillum argentinense]
MTDRPGRRNQSHQRDCKPYCTRGFACRTPKAGACVRLCSGTRPFGRSRRSSIRNLAR